MAAKPVFLALACLLSTTACTSQRNVGDVPWREPNPHWAAFHTPWKAKNARATIGIPSGHRLCSTAESFSSLLAFYVPLDGRVACEQLPASVDWKEMPDFIYIEPASDVPMTYKDTADVVADDHLLCHNTDDDHPGSDAKSAIMPAGKTLAGLETTVCVREDAERDRYTKAYVAYRPGPNLIGDTYKIGAYVHLKNKREADALLGQIVRLFKLLP